jgi:hypothetical protein
VALSVFGGRARDSRATVKQARSADYDHVGFALGYIRQESFRLVCIDEGGAEIGIFNHVCIRRSRRAYYRMTTAQRLRYHP